MDCFYRLITESVLIHKSFPVPLLKDNWFSVILIQYFLIGSKCNNFFWISQISRNFKENSNSQGILNWIIQIQIITGSDTKISKTHRLLKKILLSLSAFLCGYCGVRFFRLPSDRAFSVLGHSTPRNYLEF